MKTKMLLAAASSLAIAACGDADTEVAEYDEDEVRVAGADEDGAVETLLSEEQPPLEGDNPFDDAAAEIDTELAEADAELDEFGNEVEAESEEFERDAERFAGTTEAELDELGNEIGAEANEFERDTERFAATTVSEFDDDDDDDADYAAGTYAAGSSATTSGMSGTRTASADLAPTVTDGVSAKRYTAQNTDAYVAEDGELITGSEAALLSGSWDVMIGEDGRSLPLMIDGEGDQARGTFDGEPITVAVTGRNFQFDAPVDMDGDTTLMTFTGTFENGEIDNGVVEAQGDGSTMTFTAERDSDFAAIPTTDADVDADADMDMDMDMDAGTRMAPAAGTRSMSTGSTMEMDDDSDVVIDTDASGELDGIEDDAYAPGSTERSMNTTTRDTGITPRSNYDAGVDTDTEADRLMREQMEADRDEDDDRPSGIMRGYGASEIEEPLDARGDVYTSEDSGFADEELDDSNREVDGRDQAIDPLSDDDDALDEAMDDDPNFDPSF